MMLLNNGECQWRSVMSWSLVDTGQLVIIFNCLMAYLFFDPKYFFQTLCNGRAKTILKTLSARKTSSLLI
jgi:hypothetical protein